MLGKELLPGLILSIVTVLVAMGPTTDLPIFGQRQCSIKHTHLPNPQHGMPYTLAVVAHAKVQRAHSSAVRHSQGILAWAKHNLTSIHVRQSGVLDE